MPCFQTSDGVTIHYETAGEGPPLVFIHGWGMSGRVWRLQQGLADRYRLIIPDLRGHGRSSAPDSGYSFEDFARDLEELLSFLRLDTVVIIAWSMGVLTTLGAFQRIRERLAALVFVSGTPKFTADADYSHGLPPSETRGLGLRLKRDHDGAIREFVRGMFTKAELSQGCYDRLFSERLYGEAPGEHAAREALKSLACADFRPALSSVDLPVFLVHGSADIICPATASRYMAGLLPDARLEIMEGVGHAPFVARPAEFISMVRKFVDAIHADD